MRWVIAALLAAHSATAPAATLKPETSEAFDRYVRQTEQRLDSRPSFLWADESPARAQQIRAGTVIVEPAGPTPQTAVPGGLVHDWVGAVFLPGVSLERTLALLRDYNRHQDFFQPEVVGSRILEQSGDRYRVYLRLLKKQILTVVLDTEHEVRYIRIDADRWRSLSRSTRIAEVQKPGTSAEHALAPGHGQGFLWRLNSYWRLQRRDGGTWVECRAVSLSRDIPTGLSWLVLPIIEDLPKQSLENTLRETRAALEK